ncbi:protein CREG1-like [Agrilus planipennis]|uniref:Protein CREG1-like n=1 Tax=Agrilus planipennis TaxID=224129 RepID=A0A1W4XND9_AGRPL|nr:protein CREG1-like [Agrilus planipennis]
MLIFVALSFLFVITSSQGPPDPSNDAAVARYVIHNSDWASMATISTLNATLNYPFVSVKSMADGPSSNGTGVPYFYITPREVSGQDIQRDNRVTIMATLAQSDYCAQQSLDPQSPRCPRAIISGRLVEIPQNASDYQFARDSLFSRHPGMDSWPAALRFYVAKLNIEQVLVWAQVGRMRNVPLSDYFNPPA